MQADPSAQDQLADTVSETQHHIRSLRTCQHREAELAGCCHLSRAQPASWVLALPHLGVSPNPQMYLLTTVHLLDLLLETTTSNVHMLCTRCCADSGEGDIPDPGFWRHTASGRGRHTRSQLQESCQLQPAAHTQHEDQYELRHLLQDCLRGQAAACRTAVSSTTSEPLC